MFYLFTFEKLLAAPVADLAEKLRWFLDLVKTKKSTGQSNYGRIGLGRVSFNVTINIKKSSIYE